MSGLPDSSPPGAGASAATIGAAHAALPALPNRPVAFHTLAKPIGPICNLDCSYCFYLHKENFFPKGENFRMSEEVLEQFIRQYIEGQDVPQVDFAWQGGEPTLLGVAFFRKAIELQKKHCPPGKTITNAFQTNGVLLDDEWCEFLKMHDFLVGLSIDGPKALHDKYRVDKQGGSSFDAVMRGLGFLKQHGVRVNSLTVVNRGNENHGREVYRFLRDECGFEHLQFIPIVEQTHFETVAPHLPGAETRKTPQDPLLKVTPWTVRTESYGRFLCSVFDEWVYHDVGKVYVQQFETTLGSVMGLPAALCVFSKTCGRALAIEHDGSFYSCDHFVYPEYKLGNIREQTMRQMVRSEPQLKFGLDKFDSLPRYCRRCEYLELCYGECPKNRFIQTPDGEEGLNYLCAGLKIYFAHVTPVLARMAKEIRAGREAAGVMRELQAAAGTAPALQPRRPLRPNEPCRCGSGKKFKKCCGGN